MHNPAFRGLGTYLRLLRVTKLHQDAATHVQDPAQRASHRVLAQRFKDEAIIARARLTDAGRARADEVTAVRQAVRQAKAIARSPQYAFT